nr:chloroplast ferredoxin-7 [Chlamydomonas sp. UWO 241]
MRELALAHGQARGSRKGTVAVTFALGADDDCDGSGCVTVSAVKGEDLLGVAQRAGVALTLGCCSGSCGVCEVEVTVYTDGERERADDGNTSVVRTCIGRVPPGCVSAIVRDLPGDDIWGGEGGSGGVQW